MGEFVKQRILTSIGRPGTKYDGTGLALRNEPSKDRSRLRNKHLGEFICSIG